MLQQTPERECEELFAHVTDAMIAAQLEPINAEDFLRDCDAVLVARHEMAELRAAEAV